MHTETGSSRTQVIHWALEFLYQPACSPPLRRFNHMASTEGKIIVDAATLAIMPLASDHFLNLHIRIRYVEKTWMWDVMPSHWTLKTPP